MRFSKFLSVTMVVFFSMNALKPVQEGESVKELPTENWTQIATNLIESDNLEKTVKAITSFAELNWHFNAIINDPKNMKTLLQLIAEKIPGVTIYEVAAGLRNMPGVKSQEIQSWVKKYELIDMLVDAAHKQNFPKVQQLIQQGVDINALDTRSGKTALYQATASSGEITIVPELLKAGSNVNVQNKDGSTPLMIAVKYGNLPIIREILKYNPNLNLASKNGRTALNIAKEIGNEEVLSLLNEYQRTQAKK